MSSGVDITESIEGSVPRPRRDSERAHAVTTQPGSRRWRRRLVQIAIATDVAVIALVASIATVIGDWGLGPSARFNLVAAALVLAGLTAYRAWERGVLGQGAEEFNRVLRGTAAAAIVLALAGMAFKVEDVRPWIFGVIPATGAGLLLGRYAVRRVLHRARREARCMSPVLVVGSEAAIADLVARTRRVPHHGWTVVAACTSTGAGEIAGVPVVGDLDDVARHVHELGIEVVAVAPTPGWTPKRLHSLAWDLEGAGVELVVDPGLMEVTGPRLHVAPVDGLPLLRLTEPRWGGPARIAKNLVERVVAGALVLLLAPVFLTLAVLIRRDGGPVFYRQERIGRAGQAFRMIKFRSMVVDADRQVAQLVATNEGAGPLFKMKHDPRVTRVGRFLRRLSLDELPQLFNVIGGSMSLVGPRPPLQREVATYTEDALRKLLVRPGMTGLWQVNGRSDLTWEESVRLDLRYVENWSPFLDVSILWKTVGAVFRGRGAY
ncbi:sugar transferase [Actinomycetospora cinnamomea]|uniref:Undecaprenyl-phosphate galactose phosphotransferase WbaP/exopolysaccharide biosynthesis polyprenyl glycosylphosphotransferase n=1 Tax=Actinomycetospora cinnamomea TaxID=663609 RepID=A0A2U1EVI3_9PSEU|nr:Undecaprenyl-phosphate galactose phosphotransferase WbaP/exopolysaccharide biosynthesis polyprenyl glycosylphosphotransferase [Actinomycetospora cinnamomea]